MKNNTVNVIPATKVALNRDQIFTYLPPRSGKLKPGQLVQVPFGRRKIAGIVSGSPDTKVLAGRLKAISKIVDPEAALTETQIKLAQWIADHYVTSLGLVIKTMLPKRSVRPPKFVATKSSLEKPANLTTAQSQALETVFKGKNQTTLLHGITGSGKTEVYLQALARTLAQGKQAIVLIPEISLTPQTIKRFTRRFGARQVAILHSRLPYGKKYREWLRIRSEQATVIIGPRSALFAPVQKLGLIVIDEEHETSYKQWDKHPRYHSREVAIKYAELTGARVILGSATPALESFYKARQGEYNLATINERINKAPLPQVDILDMRNELAAGNKSILSEELQQQIKRILSSQEQAILFINRRGAATFVMCRDCGHVIECPHCSVSLTYHWQAGEKLLCHHCGYHETTPRTCPECSSSKIKFFGAGTQKVEAEVGRLFPDARVIRMDTDTTTRSNAHADLFHKFAQRQADILIGTQMIAKGFDLPNVALVGIISADTNLNFPDLRAHERTFQLLTQVAGRTGRRDQDGKVILQTYHPNNSAIAAAAKHDYQKFYETEMRERKTLQYPPLSRFVKLTLTGNHSDTIKGKADGLAREITRKFHEIDVLGPASAFVERVNNRYSWHLLLKTKKIPRSYLRTIDPAWSIDIDPVDLL